LYVIRHCPLAAMAKALCWPFRRTSARPGLCAVASRRRFTYFWPMATETVVTPRPPDGLRPGQIGVVMIGRVIIGDIAATLADLSIRQLLQVEETGAGDSNDWLVSPLLASAPHYRAESLSGYERTLLEGLAAHGSAVRLRTLGRGVLDRTRGELIGDAVHRGWLHRLHHDQRTEAAEELARRVRAFQRDLRRLKAQGNAEALAGELLPYALHFGMAGQDTPALARFAHAFTAAFASLDGWHPSAPRRPDFGGLDDAVSKPSIDEQIMSPTVGMGVWLTGW
jgi:hypothetical protein